MTEEQYKELKNRIDARAWFIWFTVTGYSVAIFILINKILEK